MSEHLLEETLAPEELLPSPEETKAAFDEIVEGIDEAYDEMTAEEKEAITEATSGEKQLWNSDSQNNFGSEPPTA